MLIGAGTRHFASHSRVASRYAAVWPYVAGSYSQAVATRIRPRKHARCVTTTARHALEGKNLAWEQTVLDAYKSQLSFPDITHKIESLDDPTKAGQDVVLSGYLSARRDLSAKMSFVDLISRDLKHSIQVLSRQQKESEPYKAHSLLKRQGAHTPVVIKGRLQARRQDPDSKPDLSGIVKVQSLEVALSYIQVLNGMPKDILVTPDAVYPPEQRHLQMRQDKSIRDALEFRSKLARLCRAILSEWLGFVEVETPLLFKSTPEGAREFVVPTRQKGLAYALPQSPQQFKQVLMGSGIPRYYQIARCFRDEDLRADRQPEFTQLDLEMAFADGEDVMNAITTLIRSLWTKMLGKTLHTPFPRMTYAEAMANYGVDKPDLRYGKPLKRVETWLPANLISKITPLAHPAVDALVLSTENGSARETQQFISSFLDSSDGEVFRNNPEGGPGVFVIDRTRPLHGLQSLEFEAAEKITNACDLQQGDLLILQAREDTAFSGGSLPIGNLRTALWREAVKQGLVEPAHGFQPLWVTDFPLFSPVSDAEPGQGGAAGLASTHHPFTSPKTARDVDLLLESPRQVIGEHYDLVMNGVELGGGSRRIHNADMQRLIMERVLKMRPDRVAEFSHLLDVLRAGCPPHAGIALGFDRLVAVMLGKSSLREVIAFPKNGSGQDVLMKSPGTLSQAQLDTYHLQLKN